MFSWAVAVPGFGGGVVDGEEVEIAREVVAEGPLFVVVALVVWIDEMEGVDVVMVTEETATVGAIAGEGPVRT